MNKTWIALSAGLLMAGSLAGCSDGTSSAGPPSGAVVINVSANTGARAWVEEAAGVFNAEGVRTASRKPIWISVSGVEAGQAVVDMAGAGDKPGMWIPDDPSWIDLAASRGSASYKGDCVSVASSPLVIAMYRPIAEALGYPARNLGWLDMSSLTSDASAWQYYTGGQFGRVLRMGHAHPGLSGSGMGALMAVVQAARATATAVPAAEIKQPIVQASVGAFEGGIAFFGTSTEQLGALMAERGAEYLGAAVMYESTVAEIASKDADIVPVYPFEGTFVASHPACINSAAQADVQEGARKFRDALLADKGQQSALARGLRPASTKLKIAAPLTADGGFDLAQPKITFGVPVATALDAVQELWKSARKPVNLVMVLDVSGSMQGDKITRLKAAAVDFVGQMANDDQLTVLTFSTDIRTLVPTQRIEVSRASAASAVRGIAANGNTALWDAIGSGADVIKRTNTPRRTNVLVVLTDGLDNASRTWKQADASKLDPAFLNMARANNTTVFTIAYGGDAEVTRLKLLAQGAQGNFYTGTEANIASVYQEMSAAFGGSAGIGR